MENKYDSHIVNHPIRDGLILGVLSSALAPILGLLLRDPNSQEEFYKYPVKPKTSISVDVNCDGLDDLVDSYGHVSVKQENGTYIPLKNLLDKEVSQVQLKYKTMQEESCKLSGERMISKDVNQDGIEDVIQSNGNVLIGEKDKSYTPLSKVEGKEIDSVKQKYTFSLEQIRNSVDNLDYKVNTGRYVLGQ